MDLLVSSVLSNFRDGREVLVDKHGLVCCNTAKISKFSEYLSMSAVTHFFFLYFGNFYFPPLNNDARIMKTLSFSQMNNSCTYTCSG